MPLVEWLLQADVPQVLLVFITVFLVIILTRRLLVDLRAPPGPWGYPIVGYQPFLKAATAAEDFKALSEKYGDVFSMRLGQRMTIVLSSFQSVKDTFIRNAEIYNGRMDGFNVFSWFSNFHGVFATDGELWKDQRRFLLSTLRDFGFAKLSLEDVIHEETEAFKSFLIESDGKPLDLAFPLSKVSANVICHILFGKRLDYNDPKLERLLRLNDDVGRSFSMFQYKDTLPLIRFLPASWTGMDKLSKVRNAFLEFIDEIIADHEETFDPDNLRDVLDVYFHKAHEKGVKPQDMPASSLYYKEHMRANCMNLFAGGLDSISVTLMWVFKLLMLHPDVKTKVQEEIDTVVGRSRLPSWTDRPNLAYTESTLMETLRYVNFMPLNAPHANMEETELYGYTIPRKASIYVNFWQIHNDPKLWKNPEEFNPSRFIDKNGKYFKPEHFLSFSTGGRVCLGESFARMELLLFFAMILQNFDLLPPEGETVTIATSQNSIRRLDHFKIRSVLRS